MDKEKFEKMFERMKACCTDEEGLAHCSSMMKKMMQFSEKKETGKKKNDTEEKE